MSAASQACAFLLTGLIWVIQLVHYPSFRFVEPARFREFHAFHSRTITWLVAPLMAAELLSTALTTLRAPGWFWGSQLALVLLTWAGTALLSVPQHEVLARGWAEHAATRLVRTNWLRTAAWTLRSVLLLALPALAA